MSINRNPRNHQLLSQIPDSNPFKKTVVPRAFDLLGDYEKDRESIFGTDERGVELRRDLSPEGKRGEAQKAIRRAIRDLRDLQKPLQEFRAKTETMRAAVRRPDYDKTDIVAALARRELRDRSRDLTFGQRAALMTGPDRDVNFIDAVLELEPWVSGIDKFNPNELQIYEAARQERTRDFHGQTLDQIAARESMETEAMMVINVVRNDLATDSGLESREFEAFAKPIETRAGAPWLVNNRTQVCEVAPDGTASYRPASTDEIRDGKEYGGLASYLASRVA
jgi:hypothetical protein